MQGAVNGTKAAKYLEVAEDLTYTCWQMCNQTFTGKCLFAKWSQEASKSRQLFTFLDV